MHSSVAINGSDKERENCLKTAIIEKKIYIIIITVNDQQVRHYRGYYLARIGKQRTEYRINYKCITHIHNHNDCAHYAESYRQSFAKKLTSRRLVRPTGGDTRLRVVDEFLGQTNGVYFVRQFVRRAEFDQHRVVEVTQFLVFHSRVTDDPGHRPSCQTRLGGDTRFARNRFPLVGRQRRVAKKTRDDSDKNTYYIIHLRSMTTNEI